MSFFPNNTVAEFTTKLPDMISLDDDYEVALVELIYPHSFNNIHGSIAYNIEVSNERDGFIIARYVVPSGYYETEAEFLQYLLRMSTVHFI